MSFFGVSISGRTKKEYASDEVDFARNHTVFVGNFDGLGIANPVYARGQPS
jgi:hypothetical protein